MHPVCVCACVCVCVCVNNGCAAVYLMDDAAYVDRRRLGGQPLCGSGDDGMPTWMAAKLRLLRPIVQSWAKGTCTRIKIHVSR